ncbi:MAG TPA: LON peptidase substrate-binding domain-containing protein, partial [Pyrinomonadaceae bacterium]|nr:LON peptidase substrate-binding domain-containing protein [Pyrinomonadaceae bacterium]
DRSHYMSEAMEKVLGVKQLPLFPLPLVLLPNEVLPLHIFEPRYRQMVSDIELRRNLFGLTFVNTEEGLPERPALGSVGCAAEVREKTLLPDGRSNIITSGVIRYRLIDYVDDGSPYFKGDVEFFEDEAEPNEDVQSIADEVFALFERIAKAAFKLSGNRGSFPEIPKADPEPLSFLVTAAFNLDNDIKYRMLEMTSTSERLHSLCSILLQAVDKMEANAEIVKAAQTNGHTKKDIDI